MKRPLLAAVTGCCVVHLVALIGLVGLDGWWWLSVVVAALAMAAAVTVARSGNAPNS